MNCVIIGSNLNNVPAMLSASGYLAQTYEGGSSMSILTQKHCGGCEQWKDKSQFAKNKANKDGLAGWCKSCHRAYYRANKEQIIVINKAYAENNKGKIQAYKNQWYQGHSEITKERAAQSRLKNPATPEQNRKATLKKRYGITPEEYDRMYLLQGGCCAICGNHRKRLHVDHNHQTKKVRELLCENCNRALGMVKEDVSIMQKAIDYLERWVR